MENCNQNPDSEIKIVVEKTYTEKENFVKKRKKYLKIALKHGFYVTYPNMRSNVSFIYDCKKFPKFLAFIPFMIDIFDRNYIGRSTVDGDRIRLYNKKYQKRILKFAEELNKKGFGIKSVILE